MIDLDLKEFSSSMQQEQLSQRKSQRKSCLLIFEKKHKSAIDDISKNLNVLYLLHGSSHCGKTTILRDLFEKVKVDHLESVFLNGNRISTPKIFLDGIGGRNKEKGRDEIERTLRGFKDRKLLFIDDFDKMLDILGKDFTAFLRATIQKIRIGVVVTVTTQSDEFKKTIINYKAPFYRFFMPIKIEYGLEDIKFLMEKSGKNLTEKDREKIVDLSGDNIEIIEMLIKNYENLDKDISRSINRAIEKQPSVVEMFMLINNLTKQQKGIVETLCKIIIEKEYNKEGASIKDIAKETLLDPQVVRTQVNRLKEKNIIEKKENRLFFPNLLILENERIKLKEEHTYRGILLQNLKSYDEAEKEYRDAIRINPNYADAHNNLGNLLKNLKRYEEAEKEYREAIKINPDYAYTHNNLGNLLQNLKRYEEAENEYREAIKINPDYAEIHNNLGNLLQNLKRYEEAEKEYREAIKINPNDILAHQNISELYFVIKDYKKSLEYAEKSLEISKEIKYKIISKFLILINLIALERKCEKEKKEFLNFIRENKGYQLTWKFETIKERIKEMKFEREILELTEEIEKFRVRK